MTASQYTVYLGPVEEGRMVYTPEDDAWLQLCIIAADGCGVGTEGETDGSTLGDDGRIVGATEGTEGETDGGTDGTEGNRMKTEDITIFSIGGYTNYTTILLFMKPYVT